MAYVEIHSLNKELKKKTVLNQITASFEQGKIYGLYGRNGCGKTMLLRAIAGLIYPTSGKIIVGGKELHKDISFPESVGVIIENTSLLPQFDAYTNLKHLAEIKKIATEKDIQRALERVGLADEKKKVRAYSLGMRQRLAIAQAIFEKPELLLLDEPTNALDEESVEKIRDVLLEEKQRGAAIILASHDKEDMKYLCDEVVYMADGKFVVERAQESEVQDT